MARPRDLSWGHYYFLCIHINDIVNLNLKCKIILYADDIVINIRHVVMV